MTIALGILGLILLIVGAELLVRGASQLAISWGVAPLVVGLTVVAFGTSSPELAVSIRTSLEGDGALAIGNALGSNVFNILAILGLAAVISPQMVESKLIKLDVPLMIAAAGLVWIFAADGTLAVWEGAILASLIVAYTVWTVLSAKKDPATVDEADLPGEPEGMFGKRWVQVVAMVVGFGLLLGGAELLVAAAVEIARMFGMPEVVIGLTIVAAGTSLPELATTVVAAFRGAREIAVGNVVGSNIFNALGVTGLASITAGGIVVPETVLAVDLPVMFVVSLCVLPVIYTGSKVSRLEGAALLAGLVAYWGYLLA